MTVTLPADVEIARHEAAHAAAALALGWPPRHVRIDWPGRDTAGRHVAGSVGYDFSETGRDLSHDALADMLIAVLAGPLTESVRVVHDWPVNLDDERWDEAGVRSDGEQLAFLTRFLELDEVDYRWFLFRAARLMRTRPFRALQSAIASRLLAVEIVGQPELIEMAEAV